jgi:hypothetical protein
LDRCASLGWDATWIGFPLVALLAAVAVLWRDKRPPAFVAVDSFRTIVGDHRPSRTDGVVELARFVNQLSQQLTTWETTSFLIGEYADTPNAWYRPATIQ